MPYFSHFFHLVFNTKYNTRSLTSNLRPDLYAVMASKFTEMKCKLISINGVEDHCHILVSIHPSVSVSEVVQKVKLAASAFLKDHYPYCGFRGWKPGYASLTFDKSHLADLINYVENQEVHHSKKSFIDELKMILEDHGIEYDPRFID